MMPTLSLDPPKKPPFWSDAPHEQSHCRMLLAYATQLSLFTSLVALLIYKTTLHGLMERAFINPSYILLVLLITLITVVFLICVRSTVGVNTLALLLFTGAFSVLFAGLHVVFQSNMPLVICVQWTLAVIILAMFNGLSHDRFTFLTTSIEGLLTFILVVIVSSVFYAILPGFITGKELGYSILTQFILIAWISYDTTLIFSELYVDEAHLGAIYFPIHLFIFLGYLVMIAVSVLSSAAMVSGGGGIGCGSDWDGECADCIGGRCTSVCCCCVWCYDECERNPPYRPKRKEIQSTARIEPFIGSPVSTSAEVMER